MSCQQRPYARTAAVADNEIDVALCRQTVRPPPCRCKPDQEISPPVVPAVSLPACPLRSDGRTRSEMLIPQGQRRAARQRQRIAPIFVSWSDALQDTVTSAAFAFRQQLFQPDRQPGMRTSTAGGHHHDGKIDHAFTLLGNLPGAFDVDQCPQRAGTQALPPALRCGAHGQLKRQRQAAHRHQRAGHLPP